MLLIGSSSPLNTIGYQDIASFHPCRAFGFDIGLSSSSQDKTKTYLFKSSQCWFVSRNSKQRDSKNFPNHTTLLGTSPSSVFYFGFFNVLKGSTDIQSLMSNPTMSFFQESSKPHFTFLFPSSWALGL